MPSLQSGTKDRYTIMREMKWSQSEKSIARRAFEQALQNECEALTREVQRRAAQIQQPSDLWNLEDYLRERRKDIDARYDYRYSMLPFVFADLIRTGRLNEQDLDGLKEEKLAQIRELAAIYSADRPG